VKSALIVGLGTIVVAAAAMAAVTHWSGPGGPKGALTPIELAWIRRFYEHPCPATRTAPTESLRRTERIARAACGGQVPWARVYRSIQARFFDSRPLPESIDVVAKSHIDPRLGRVVTRLAHRHIEARCWTDDDWIRVNVEVSVTNPKLDYWVIGLADSARRVHFRGDICQTLARFYGSTYTPSRKVDRAVLATALVVLAHEAEHQYDDFSRSEAEVECIAVQHVRDLVRQAGRSKAFAADIASYAWDVSYLRGDPIYGTARCRNRGPLDLHPSSDVWP
jgi:hypothetical protein